MFKEPKPKSNAPLIDLHRDPSNYDSNPFLGDSPIYSDYYSEDININNLLQGSHEGYDPTFISSDEDLPPQDEPHDYEWL